MEDIAIAKDIESLRTIIAYLPVADSEEKYVLSKKQSIAGINLNQKTVSGPWPLTRWSPEITNPIVKNLYRPSPEWIDSSGWDPLVDENYLQEIEGETYYLGCLNMMPLRYGDIDGDGQNELVLFLGAFDYKRDMVVFSPERQRITFSMRYALQDFISFPGSKHQYIQRTRQRGNNIGVRTYAKAFVGNFDGDDFLDILVWRKRYESRDASDGVSGFRLTAQTWQHFERDLTAQAASETDITGEYLPQDTSEITIQGWLSANELTWQKGYPSTSECQDHEGEVIPEMHDPLLNDPDVLK
ncbi:hypothetical Protein YC6258_00812 [Gynuella sunshinyii YC6258]|uniref:Uncharacterized protein n=1 Tax=Gynuella sunshinyii YC6258 TaxID=1445510 RepID=A0A0C5VEA7_9GAMM|nr:hypothetical Protein YC6258_00812 [Gynuella sunshinyii YC6258]